jgi:CheY-like chemotaxis protein
MQSDAGGGGAVGARSASVTARRVLVVDDDDHIREVATLALEVVAGWSVISTNSGVDAAELARAERPDAVLLDVMMPEVDGPTTVARLREDPATAGIPVILLTAKNVGMDRVVDGELPVAGLIAKPFDPMTLAGEVSRQLGWDEPT